MCTHVSACEDAALSPKLVEVSQGRGTACYGTLRAEEDLPSSDSNVGHNYNFVEKESVLHIGEILWPSPGYHGYGVFGLANRAADRARVRRADT